MCRIRGHIDPGLNLGSHTYCVSSGELLNLSGPHIQQGQEEYLLHRVIVKSERDRTENAWCCTRHLVGA